MPDRFFSSNSPSFVVVLVHTKATKFSMILESARNGNSYDDHILLPSYAPHSKEINNCTIPCPGLMNFDRVFCYRSI